VGWTVLWKLEADSVVATVFGIHKGRWKPLNVMREEDLQLEGRVSVDQHQPQTLLLLDSRPSSSSSSSTAKQDYRSYYDAPLMHWFEHYRSKQQLVQPVDGRKALPASSGVAEIGIDADGQQMSSSIFRHCFPGRLDCPGWLATQLRLPAPTAATTESNPTNGMKESPSSSVTMVQPDGLLLSWRIVTIMLALVIYGVVLGRIWYLHKKQSWLDANHAVSQGSTESTVEAPPFAHSRSLEVPPVDRRSSSADATALRRSISLPDTHQHLVRPDPSPSQLLNKSAQALLPVHEASPSGGHTSPVSITNGLTSIPTAAPATSGEDATLSAGGAGSGIPLVRYSRYASEYMELGPLGKGGFGSVYQCKNVLDGREYAIKKVSIRSHKGDSDPGFEQRLERTLREVKILAVLDHPNIVRYFGAWLEIEKEEAVDELEGDNSLRGFSRCYSSSMITESVSQRPLNLNCSHRGSRIGQETSEDSGSYVYNPPPRQPFFSRRIPLDDCGFIFEESEEEGGDGQSDPANDTKGGNQAGGPLLQSARDGSQLSSLEDRTDRVGLAPLLAARPETGPLRMVPPSPPRIVRHTLYIQMQLCSHRTVGDFLSDPASRKGSMLSKDGSVDIPMALRLFLQIALAVRHVHDQGLIHRDLKPQNCFMDESGNVKVGDFGLSRESADTRDDSVLTESKCTTSLAMPVAVGDDHTAGVGTRAYASPEQMNGSAYDSSTDVSTALWLLSLSVSSALHSLSFRVAIEQVYSLGIILFELVYPMYTGMERNICLSRLRHGVPVLPKDWETYVGNLFPTLSDLVLSMVSYDASRRPTAASVAQHVQSILNEFTIVSLDDSALLRQDIILLRVEARHSPDALSQTIRAIEESAADSEHQVQVVQYGLRSSNAVAIMEFALEYSGSGSQLVSTLCDRPSILKVRQVSTGPHLAQQNMQYLASS
jgi:serine/threonine protein kinase